MTKFTTHTVDSAPEASKPLLENIEKAFGFVPNLMGNMAEAPAILEAYMTLSGIFKKTDLSETERQVILITSNRLNGCKYCMAAHTATSLKAGVPQDVLDSLRDNTPIADPKLEALRQFSIVMVESRGWPSQADAEAFLAAGYTQQNMLEVILGTGLKVLSNYTNHITQTTLDERFEPFKWTGEKA